MNNAHTDSNSFKGHLGMPGKSLPYRIWISGNFSQDAEALLLPQLVTRQNIDQVLHQAGIKLEIVLDNLVPQSDTQSIIKLPLTKMQDFEPLSIAQNVPAFSALLNCHQALKNRQAETISQQQCRDILSSYADDPVVGRIVLSVLQELDESNQSAVQHKPAKQDEDVDRLLGMLDLGTEQSNVSSQSNVSETSPQHGVLQRGQNEISRILFKHVNKILHHDSFQALEKSWRGLALLLDQLGDTDVIEIAIIDCDKQNLLERFDNALAQTGDEQLPSLLINDFLLDCTSADLTMLDELGQLCEAWQIPAVVNVSNQFLGVHNAAQLNGRSSLASLFSQAQYVKWNSLRKKKHARWLCVTFNRFVLREVYSRHNESVLAFNEWLDSDDYLLWGGGSILLVREVIASLQHNQWPTELTLFKNKHTMDLATHTLALSAQVSVQTTLEYLPDDNLQDDLTNFGINTLQAQPNTKTAGFKHLVMLYRPDKFDDPLLDLTQQTRNSLPHCLLSARIALLIILQLESQFAGHSIDSVQTGLKEYLSKLIADSGENSNVEVNLKNDLHHPGQKFIHTKITMGSHILNGGELELQLPL